MHSGFIIVPLFGLFFHLFCSCISLLFWSGLYVRREVGWMGCVVGFLGVLFRLLVLEQSVP